MKYITYVFPAAVLLLIALFYLGCPKLKGADLRESRRKAFDRTDCIALVVIVVLYAAVAFFKLGDTEAPESFAHFDAGESAVIDLGRETSIDSVMYYTGLNTGFYTVSYSQDGAFWYDAASLEQDYASLFKWEYLSPEDGADSSARYIRITAQSELYLGELAIYSGGALVTPVSCGLPELFDEQSVIPDAPSFLNSTYFDEIYHARTAYEHLEGISPYEISHPPLGKIIISAGISLFGMTPFGWRCAGALFGVLMLPVLYVLLKKMFGGVTVPACGTAIFAFDFMHFTQTRIATIDTYAVFFILLMYLFMYLYCNSGRLRYLALCGLAFGLGAACKWTCIYAGAGLAVIWLAHWIITLRQHDSADTFRAFIKNCLWCCLFFIIIPCGVYYVSYTPYGTAAGMSAPGMYFDCDYAKLVLDNQDFMFSYHSNVTSAHPYSSRWYQWIVDARPILYYLEYFADGERSSFGAFLNPVLCWVGLPAIGIMAYLTFARRDKKAGFILVGYLAQLLPWVFITRTTFEYHYFPSAVFLLLAICYVFALMRRHNSDWRIRIFGLTGMSVSLFAVFYPVLSGARVNAELAGSLLQWLPSWPF